MILRIPSIVKSGDPRIIIYQFIKLNQGFIKNGIISSKIYDRRDYFNFEIVNFSSDSFKFWAYESWDSLFPHINESNCKLMSPEHYF